MLRRLSLLVILLSPLGCSRAPVPTAPPAVQRVVIVSIDGMRPDVILRTAAPNIRYLMRNGCFTFWARTTEISITLPSHTSMLTGVTPERHEIWWNIDVSAAAVRPPAVPTIFEMAKNGGYTTAMAIGKSKLVALNKPGTVDWAYIPDGYANDIQVAQQAAKFIDQHQPQLLFAHFPDNDASGHGSGWGSAQQVRTMERSDRAVGIILAALRRNHLLDSTAVIVTADHGGSGWSHGAEDPRSRFIPWIISGPGIRKNLDLTLDRNLSINTEDTFATACFLLNLPLDEDLDGNPITQVLVDPPAPADDEDGELLRDVSVQKTKAMP